MARPRWIARLVLIVIAVELGFGLAGVAVASILAVALELLLLTSVSRVSLRAGGDIRVRELAAKVGPLLLYTIFLQIYLRIDLLLVGHITGDSTQAGFYAAAQSLAAPLGLIALAFSPILIAAALHQSRAGDATGLRDLTLMALRAPLLMVPVMVLVVASADGIPALLFGGAFGPAGAPLAYLLIAGLFNLTFSLATALLVARNEAGITALLMGSVTVTSIIAHLLVIPAFGMVGAAMVMAVSAGLGAALAVGRVVFVSGAGFPVATACRAGLLSVVVVAGSLAWPGQGWEILVKLVCGGTLIVAAYLAMGELHLPVARGWRTSFAAPVTSPGTGRAMRCADPVSRSMNLRKSETERE